MPTFLNGRNERGSERAVYLLVFSVPLILFVPLIISGRSVFWGTQITQFIPWWQQAVDTLVAADLPLWNPLNGMGAPLLANYQSAILYPPTWLMLGLGAIGGVSWIALGLTLVLGLHLSWAGIGMARLLKSMGWNLFSQAVGGLAFGMSGYLVARSHFPSIIFTAAWLPWVMLGIYQLVFRPPNVRNVINLGLRYGLMLLAGHAQTAWYTTILSILWLLFWFWNANNSLRGSRVLWSFFASVCLGVFLASAQLLPTIEYLSLSQRASAVDYEFAVAYSFWPWRFLTLIFPNLFGSPATDNYTGYAAYWEDSIYFGLLPLLLVISTIFSRQGDETSQRLKRFLLILVVFIFTLALGKNTPVYPWLYKYIPTFDMFQAPTRISIIAVFSFSILAGFGAASWKRPDGKWLYWSRLGVAGGVAIAVGAGMAWMLQGLSGTSLGDIPASYISAFAALSFWCVVAGVLNLLAPRTPHPASFSTWQWAVLVVISIDLLAISWGLNPGEDINLYQRKPDFPVNLLNQNGIAKRVYISTQDERSLKFDWLFSFETFRSDADWMNLRSALLPNTNLLDGIASANNFDPLVPARYHNWISVLENARINERDTFLSRMAVAWVEHVDFEQPIGVRFQGIQSEDRIRWVPCALKVENDNAAFDILLSSPPLASQKILLMAESIPTGDTCDQFKKGQVELIYEGANRLTISVYAETDGWLVVSDVYYPGWNAKIDGEQIEILVADTIFRAVPIPSGEHIVEMSYRPTSFYIGLLISLTTLGVGWFLWRRS